MATQSRRGAVRGEGIIMKSQSQVWINLTYKGDPFTFWGILKDMQNEAQKNGVVFHCEQVTTISTEE
jgi:hypothetical protein